MFSCMSVLSFKFFFIGFVNEGAFLKIEMKITDILKHLMTWVCVDMSQPLYV